MKFKIDDKVKIFSKVKAMQDLKNKRGRVVGTQKIHGQCRYWVKISGWTRQWFYPRELKKIEK